MSIIWKLNYKYFHFISGLYHEDKNYGNCQNVTWNPVGHGMMFEDFDKFPIFVVINQTEVDILIQDVSLKAMKYKLTSSLSL